MCRCTKAQGARLKAQGVLVCVTLALIVIPAQAGTQFPGIGRTATPAEITAWDIDVRPDFKGLPPGSGSVAQGQIIWEAKCQQCHGTFGESNEVFQPLVGGTTADDIRTGHAKALKTGGEARTTLMKLATISTLWDYIHRAMPWNAPKSLKTDDVYAVVAYILNLGDIVPGDFVLSDRNIAEVQQRLPNRNGLTREHGLADVRGQPDVHNVACMKDCPTEARVASALPEGAQTSHGDLSQQNRGVGPIRGKPLASGKAAPIQVAAAPDVTGLVKDNGCLACHGQDRKIIGPAFTDVASRYRGDSGAEAKLVDKLRKGGAGAWGSTPMPAHPALSDGDALALVRWVLSSGL
jgi:cytochrome c551/c552